MLAVDTNVVVRYVVRDDAAQSVRAQAIMREDDIYVSPTVILETEWVLRRLYRFEPKDIVRALETFCAEPNIVVGEAVAVKRALHMTELGFDCADALHFAQASECDAFVTFDKDLVRKAKRLQGVTARLA
jgi:predicted nucleic-acid-binding protein